MHIHNIIASKSPTTALPLLTYMWEESPGTVFSRPKGSSDHPSPGLYVELSSFNPFYHHKSQASLPPLLYSAILQPSWELAVLSPEKLIMWVMNFFILSGGMCHQSQYPNRIAVEGSILSLWSDGSNWPQEQEAEVLSLIAWGLFSLLWLSHWLCCSWRTCNLSSCHLASLCFHLASLPYICECLLKLDQHKSV